MHLDSYRLPAARIYVTHRRMTEDRRVSLFVMTLGVVALAAWAIRAVMR